VLHFLRDSAILTVMANRAIEFDQFVHTLLSLFLRLLSSFFRFLLLIRIIGEGTRIRRTKGSPCRGAGAAGD
ncbi:MAG: hypothetical protein U0N04_02850, partial [Oscillospiraceae bacterium]